MQSIIFFNRTLPGNHSILSYQGIPFARPPVDELRFAPPQEATKWDNILRADKQYICAQVSFLVFVWEVKFLAFNYRLTS